MKPEPGTYQTTFRVEKWERKRKTPRVQYRTTFGGPVIDHNDILTLVRKLHADKDGKARGLIQIFEDAERWNKYTLNGRNITPEIIEAIEEAEDKLKANRLDILTARQKLYDCLPTGKIDAFELLKVIQGHIKELDEFLDDQTSTETPQ